jgi:hypothetical protein
VPKLLAELLLVLELLVLAALAALVFVFAADDSVLFATGVSEFNTVGIE